jgi:outer membrane autotransporter protein
MLLYGGEAESIEVFAASEKSDTVVGAAISVSMPLGKYSDERLINLGNNRWVIRPQLGVTHTRGKWAGEITGSVFLYGDNSNFWMDTDLETDPLYALQAHLNYTFRPGLWASVGTAYGWGGEATVSGDAKNNPSGNWLTALSLGFPINSMQGIKLTYLRGRTQKSTGADTNSLILGYSVMF